MLRDKGRDLAQLQHSKGIEGRARQKSGEGEAEEDGHQSFVCSALVAELGGEGSAHGAEESNIFDDKATQGTGKGGHSPKNGLGNDGGHQDKLHAEWAEGESGGEEEQTVG